ncbi:MULTISPECIES: phage holin family protein [Arthrobacter]|uniref:Phage holin family protein n=2 Tax=Arthrobacter TaxID=1663 RepID=A0ABU9KQ60_9MICC|nr:phage holin family protein [Arthrobacter sp. YJM1]MDP5228249.1 phage holin family protein [Arthrobacter sp. YJM1]
MSGRHASNARPQASLKALPGTARSAAQLLPRQIQDEISLAQLELKGKGVQLGVATAGLVAALVFVGLLVIALVVAAIMGLATVMPAWLAALIVSAAFLIIAGIGALFGLRKLKKAMPIMPAQTIRGIKHDLGIVKEGSAFDASILEPGSPAYEAAAKAKEEAKAKAAAEAKAKAEQKLAEEGPAPTQEQLLARLAERRVHLTGIRDELGAQLDVKSQAQAFVEDAKGRAEAVKESAQQRFAQFTSSSEESGGLGEELARRWKPIAVAVAAGTAFAVLLRRLLKH